MAVSMRSCWTLALSACLVLTVSADCGADCAYCIHHLQLQKTDINSLTCTLECEGALSPKKSWELCEDVLQARNADSSTEEDKATTETSKLDNNDPHQLVKKYGGFMKRYGGFMKKTAELYGPEPDDVDHGREILFKRYGGFMKKSGEPEDTLSLLRELMRNVDGGDGGVEKRYGGFLRSARQSSDLENGIQELQKRYGGFMRRVGRPKWREEQKRYGGFLNKRAWGEEEEDEMEKERVELEDVPDVVEKRYGGFLGY